MPFRTTARLISQKIKKQTAVPCGKVFPTRNQNREQRADGFAADPGLNAEPSAGDERAQHCGEVCAEHSERSAGQNGERNSVLRAGMRVQQHGREHDQVAEEDREHRLLPVHSALNQAGGQHVGEDVDRHRNPERGEVVGAPGAALGAGGREVFVVERAGFDARGLEVD